MKKQLFTITSEIQDNDVRQTYQRHFENIIWHLQKKTYKEKYQKTYKEKYQLKIIGELNSLTKLFDVSLEKQIISVLIMQPCLIDKCKNTVFNLIDLSDEPLHSILSKLVKYLEEEKIQQYYPYPYHVFFEQLEKKINEGNSLFAAEDVKMMEDACKNCKNFTWVSHPKACVSFIESIWEKISERYFHKIRA